MSDSPTFLLCSPEGATGKHFLLQLSVKHKLPFLYLLRTKEVTNNSSSNAAPQSLSAQFQSEQNLSIGQTSYSTLRPNSITSVSHYLCLPIYYLGNEGRGYHANEQLPQDLAMKYSLSLCKRHRRWYLLSEVLHFSESDAPSTHNWMLFLQGK